MLVHSYLHPAQVKRSVAFLQGRSWVLFSSEAERGTVKAEPEQESRVQKNRYLGPARGLKKQRWVTAPRCKLLSHFPGLSLKQSSAIAVLFVCFVFGGDRKSNSLLVLHLELALLYSYKAKSFLFPFTSRALPTSYPVGSEPCLGLSQRCTGPERRNTLVFDSDWEPCPVYFMRCMVLTRIFWTQSCVVALVQDQLTVKQFPRWLGKRTKQAHLHLQKTMSA